MMSRLRGGAVGRSASERIRKRLVLMQLQLRAERPAGGGTVHVGRGYRLGLIFTGFNREDLPFRGRVVSSLACSALI